MSVRHCVCVLLKSCIPLPINTPARTQNNLLREQHAELDIQHSSIANTWYWILNVEYNLHQPIICQLFLSCLRMIICDQVTVLVSETALLKIVDFHKIWDITKAPMKRNKKNNIEGTLQGRLHQLKIITIQSLILIIHESEARWSQYN